MQKTAFVGTGIFHKLTLALMQKAANGDHLFTGDQSRVAVQRRRILGWVRLTLGCIQGTNGELAKFNLGLAVHRRPKLGWQKQIYGAGADIMD